MECYNITRKPDDDDPLEINIPVSEGMHADKPYLITVTRMHEKQIRENMTTLFLVTSVSMEINSI